MASDPVTPPNCRRCGCPAPISKRPLMSRLREWPLCKPCHDRLVLEREKRRAQRGRR